MTRQAIAADWTSISNLRTNTIDTPPKPKYNPLRPVRNASRFLVKRPLRSRRALR